MSSFVVRPVRADEWRAAKELRLAALEDPVAPLAFLETYKEAAARPDSFWQERVAGAAEGQQERRQVIAEGPDGEWVGSVVVLIEEAGTTDWAGLSAERKQGHVVGVYMRPEHRGCGLTEVLFDEALEWAWAVGAERVRLLVHEDNGRAKAFYGRVGFLESGRTAAAPEGVGGQELELVIDRA
ncbi:GNAT family N-acetyltransferase [Streptomyces sp. WI04-05B]|uniref:GNAT family N-acetyltransferase n=1 Tax=Streptomyces TaxID=1883 RepID=UPI0029BDA726|nr:MULTISPECIES: GNAT family N-acetyltransferase [unclassified Streptomyces]MDX2548936.1 GNAT family N-acetyltransferase [Streptomyces sp. WI04-05B]MDX2590571.1 GNAT family N-acetyltransferase [Streptomyces sp. WI04-05A]MDX3750692.1 GNAT family N-acetyltransferase [Streptomyces sp. AK08-02]